MLSFVPFRRPRPRHDPPPSFPPSSEDDSDDSSPERGKPRVIHIPNSKHARKPAQCLLAVPDHAKPLRGPPGNSPEGTHITLSFHKPLDAGHPERPSRKHSMSGVASDPIDVHQSRTKLTLFRRVTSKFSLPIPLKSDSQALRSRPSTRTLPANLKSHKQGSVVPAGPTLPNSFVSKEHREAALRERGLLPRKDLSEQERDADQRLGSFPSPSSVTLGGSTEAERLKESWLAMNRPSESSDSDCHGASPYLQGTKTGPRSMPALPMPSSTPDTLCHSSEGKTGLPCTSVLSLPPLMTSLLDVLHEEPLEPGSIIPPGPSPPAYLPLVVSSPQEEDLTCPIFSESPTSCNLSSHCLGSTLESQFQSDHHGMQQRARTSRGRTSNSGDQPRKQAGSLITENGTRSLTNLRRPGAESLRRPSMSTLSSTGHASSTSRAARTAISPTIHSIGSILKETGGIRDAESRRLCEIAFLD